MHPFGEKFAEGDRVRVRVDLTEMNYRSVTSVLHSRFLPTFEDAVEHEYEVFKRKQRDPPVLPPKLPDVFAVKPHVLNFPKIVSPHVVRDADGVKYKYPSPGCCPPELRCSGGCQGPEKILACYADVATAGMEFYDELFKSQKRDSAPKADPFDIVPAVKRVQPNYKERLVPSSSADAPDLFCDFKSPVPIVQFLRHQEFVGFGQSETNRHATMAFRVNPNPRECSWHWIIQGEKWQCVDCFRVLILGKDGILRQEFFRLSRYGDNAERAREAAEICARQFSPVMRSRYPKFIPHYGRPDQELPRQYADEVLPGRIGPVSGRQALFDKFKIGTPVETKMSVPGFIPVSGRVKKIDIDYVTVYFRTQPPRLIEFRMDPHCGDKNIPLFDDHFRIKTSFTAEDRVFAGQLIACRLKFVWARMKRNRDRTDWDLQPVLHGITHENYMKNLQAQNPEQAARWFVDLRRMVCLAETDDLHPTKDTAMVHPTALCLQEHLVREKFWKVSQ